MNSKQKATEGKTVRPALWKLSAKPIEVRTATKTQIHRAAMDALPTSDGGTGRTTHWPAVLRPSFAKEEVGRDGARVWSWSGDHGMSNVLDEEQFGLQSTGSVWFQRAYSWDHASIHVDFGKCAFDAVVFLRLVARMGNTLNVNQYDVTLHFQAPVPAITIAVQEHGVRSAQPSRRAISSINRLESTVKLAPKTALSDNAIVGLAKHLLDGIANEFALEDDIYFSRSTGPSFLEIDEESLLAVSTQLK